MRVHDITKRVSQRHVDLADDGRAVDAQAHVRCPGFVRRASSAHGDAAHNEDREEDGAP